MEKKNLKFTLTPNKFGSSYFAHVKHTKVVSEEKAISDIAIATGDLVTHAGMITYILNRAAAYIDQQLREGNQVTIGGIRIGLAIEGKFDSANASFDPEKHRLKVVAVPRKVMQRVIEDLTPVNETVDDPPIIESVWGASHTQGVLERGGTCGANGTNLLAGHNKGVDHIWLENTSGEVVATCADIVCSATRIEFTIPTGIAPSEYMLVMERPNKDGATHSRVRRKVSIV